MYICDTPSGLYEYAFNKFLSEVTHVLVNFLTNSQCSFQEILVKKETKRYSIANTSFFSLINNQRRRQNSALSYATNFL